MIVSNVERSRLDKIFSAGLGVADATKCVSDKLIIKDNVLFLGDKKYNLTKQKKIKQHQVILKTKIIMLKRKQSLKLLKKSQRQALKKDLSN